MRHRIHVRRLNRTTEHRIAMQRNMAQSLVQHGQITTTIAKAKAIRPFFERLVTLAVKVRQRHAAGDDVGSLRARRGIHKLLTDRSFVPAEHQAEYDAMSDATRAKTMRRVSGQRYRTGEPKGRLAFTGASIVHRLIEGVAPEYMDRPGGYTRLIHLPTRRVGDHTQLAIVQLVGEEEQPGTLTKPGKTSRARRADRRYAMAIRLAKQWSGKGRGAGKDKAGAPPKDETEEASADEQTE